MKNFLSFIAQIALMLFLLIFLAILYLIIFHMFHPETVYYFGIGTIVIGSIILIFIFFILPQNIKASMQKIYLEKRDFFPCLLVAFLIMYSFHITVPTLADRSISIYLLNQLDEQGGTASIHTLQRQFLAGYVGDYSTVCRRMAEQIESGDVKNQGTMYSLTSQGKRTIALLRAFTGMTGVNEYYVKSNDPNLLPYRYSVTATNGCEPMPVK
jgi:hypothetical protein